MASDKELSDFLKEAERKAFKRAYYHVRDEDGALDIVQDSMIKLASHYADKPVGELALLFQRILSNTILDWFRRQKTRQQWFTSTQLDTEDEDGLDLLEVHETTENTPGHESAEQWVMRRQSLERIETAIMALPARQREAFLLRYWEEMDVAETAAIMGCSEGSVKTHCSRAIASLQKSLNHREPS